MYNPDMENLIFSINVVVPIKSQSMSHNELKNQAGLFSVKAALLEICGFDVFKKKVIPSASAYTRFFKSLVEERQLLTEMFNELVGEATAIPPGFGKHLPLVSTPE